MCNTLAELRGPKCSGMHEPHLVLLAPKTHKRMLQNRFDQTLQLTLAKSTGLGSFPVQILTRVMSLVYFTGLVYLIFFFFY